MQSGPWPALRSDSHRRLGRREGYHNAFEQEPRSLMSPLGVPSLWGSEPALGTNRPSRTPARLAQNDGVFPFPGLPKYQCAAIRPRPASPSAARFRGARRLCPVTVGWGRDSNTRVRKRRSARCPGHHQSSPTWPARLAVGDAYGCRPSAPAPVHARSLAPSIAGGIMRPTPVFAHPVPGRPEAAWTAVRSRVPVGAGAAVSPLADTSRPTPRWGA